MVGGTRIVREESAVGPRAGERVAAQAVALKGRELQAIVKHGLQDASSLSRALDQRRANVRRALGKLRAQLVFVERGVLFHLGQVLLLGLPGGPPLLFLPQGREHGLRCLAARDRLDQTGFAFSPGPEVPLKLLPPLRLRAGVCPEALERPVDRRPHHCPVEGRRDRIDDRLFQDRLGQVEVVGADVGPRLLL